MTGLLLATSFAAMDVRADTPPQQMKPTLSSAADHGERPAATGLRAKGASASNDARLVSLALRDLDIGKLDAAAFGDGEDVAR